jgi:hypothetical protein
VISLPKAGIHLLCNPLKMDEESALRRPAFPDGMLSLERGRLQDAFGGSADGISRTGLFYSR